MVTTDDAATHIRELLDKVGDSRIRLYTVKKPDIRQQLIKGIRNTTTKLVVLVDDDSTWSSRTLDNLTAAFADSSVGGTIPLQRVRPHSKDLTMWECFGALNLIRRNILHSALAYFNNGQVLNLSGRTVAYRTAILKNEDFFTSLLKDYWSGRYLLKTGDDSFITSWIVQRGWKTAFQNQLDGTIVTTVNEDMTYLRQVLRWSRDTARHYYRDVRFAVRTGKTRLCIRSMLNIAVNYATDFTILAELGFLIIVSAYKLMGYRFMAMNGTRYAVNFSLQHVLHLGLTC